MREFLAFPLLEIKAQAEGAISGYASIFGNEDLTGDIVERGAFKDTLAKRAGPFPLLWSHDSAEPLGVWQEAREDNRGLLVSGKLVLSVPRALQVRDLIHAGAVRGLSIGFRTAQAERGQDGVRRIKAVDLFEISLTALPANEQAQILTMKQDDLNPVRVAERALRDAGFSRRQARALCAGGFKNIQSDLCDADPDELDELAGKVRALTSSFSQRTSEQSSGKDRRIERACRRLRGQRQ